MEYEFGNLAPHQEAREIFVARILFDDLKRTHRLTEHLACQPALMQAHRHMISPADPSKGNAVPDEGKRVTGSRRMGQTPIIKGRSTGWSRRSGPIRRVVENNPAKFPERRIGSPPWCPAIRPMNRRANPVLAGGFISCCSGLNPLNRPSPESMQLDSSSAMKER